MKIYTLLLLFLLYIVNNSALAQGTSVLTYGYQPQPYAVAPLVTYGQPVVATGYYAVPVTTYQYVPYQYVAGYAVYCPTGNWTTVINEPVIVNRGGCFAPRRYYQNYGSYYYYR